MKTISWVVLTSIFKIILTHFFKTFKNFFKTLMFLSNKTPINFHWNLRTIWNKIVEKNITQKKEMKSGLSKHNIFNNFVRSQEKKNRRSFSSSFSCLFLFQLFVCLLMLFDCGLFEITWYKFVWVWFFMEYKVNYPKVKSEHECKFPTNTLM